MDLGSELNGEEITMKTAVKFRVHEASRMYAYLIVSQRLVEIIVRA